MKEEILKPLSNKKENLFVVLFSMVIILISIFLINYNKLEYIDKKIEKNEISSFESFNNIENAIYLELENFLFELSFYEDISEFPDIKKLEEENHYPFIKYNLQQRAKILWFNNKNIKKNIYLGISQDINISGNFLIESIKEEDKISNNIYYSKENMKNFDENFSNIKEKYNFKKVISLKGNDLLEEKWK